jgi:hypothetical protein
MNKITTFKENNMIKTRDKLLADVKKFVSKYCDTAVYTQEEWQKKESQCHFGEVVFVAEGELYYALNGQHGRKEKDAIIKIARKHQCYIEKGFDWSWHFCSVEEL